MKLRIIVAALALALAGCQRGGEAAKPDDAQLAAPSSGADAARVYAPANAAARNATGDLNVSLSLRLPDRAGGETQETLSLRADKGLVVEARLANHVALATEVQGQTLRTLLALPVEEQQTFVYHVVSETHPEGVSGLCGATPAAYVVVWEPSTGGEASYKVIGFSGGAPGAAEARACLMLEYVRR